MAQVSGIPEDVSLFYKELDEFEIQLPGNKMEPFYCDETLLEITGKQYPKWKNQGWKTAFSQDYSSKQLLIIHR